jgi:periplasmic protein TonB
MFSDAFQARSRSIAIAASIAWHAAIGVSLLWVMRDGPAREATATPRVVETLPSIVWLDQAGLSGGESGGGNETQSPPQQARRVGTDRLTVPVTRPPDPLATPTPEVATPDPGLEIPAVAMASALDSLPGTIQPQPGPPTIPNALGPGTGDGARGERGPGDGRRSGAGLDDGGPYRPGGRGVTPPVPLYRGTPRYTPEAVQARAQGSVLVECIVQPTGRCTDFRVVRSIQPPLGLDREAVAAAGEWRFKPGTFGGEQVPVLVTIEVAFAIR